MTGAGAGPLLGVVGDVHGRMDWLGLVLDRLREARVDAVLAVGDLGSGGFGRTLGDRRRLRDTAAEVLAAMRALGVPVVYVPGNHDLPDLGEPGNVDGRLVEVAGLRVVGLGGAGPGRFGFPYEWDEDDVRRRRLPGCDLLLSHAPPARTVLDRTASGQHVGSEAVRELCARARVLVCGHIHEAPGVERVGDCLCLNAGALGRPYGRPQVGFVRGTDEVWHEDLRTGRVVRLARDAG